MISISSPSPRKLLHSTSGQIQVILGPMFSGKTTELIRRCKRYQIATYKCVVVKYARDNRYSTEELSTHDKISLPAIAAVKLSDILDQLVKFEIIGIDEGQFFPDIVVTAEQLANAGKTVIVAALDGTFQRQLEVIGGSEIYMAVCRKCYFQRKTSPQKPCTVLSSPEKFSSTSSMECESSVVGRPSPRRPKNLFSENTT